MGRLTELRERSEKRHRPNPKVFTFLGIAFSVLAALTVVLLFIPEHHSGSPSKWLLALFLISWIFQAAVYFWRGKQDRVRQRTWVPPT